MTFKRWTLARRMVQLAVVLLLVSPLAGLTVFSGSLAAADLIGLPLVDPLAALQVVMASGVAVHGFLLSAAAVACVYLLTGGRTFCSWICPVYLAAEAADSIRCRLGSGERTFPLAAKNWLLLLLLVVVPVTGLPLFEIISPIGMFTRAVAYGGYTAAGCLAGLLLVELFLARRVWCRSLCPLGGFYSLLGRISPVKVWFTPARCTSCGECSRVCPVEEVLEPSLNSGEVRIVSGDCTRCGVCIDICPHQALQLRISAKSADKL